MMNDKKIWDKKITGPANGVLSRPGNHVPDTKNTKTDERKEKAEKSGAEK
jgi:hypothetical protein